ncbi:MAG: acyl-CoA desaturase [Bacteroidetes bacterium]|nr:acyl-CoA desaturase [Bacteroidota bacterium]
MLVIVFFIAQWYLSLFCQTFFQHRYAAHGAFTMSRGWERFFFVLTFIFQGSSYLSTRAYAIMHRMHHAYADTDKDPHSPKYSKNIFDMMWKTYVFYRNINEYRVAIDAKFTKNVPDWPAFDKFAGNRYTRLFWVALYIGFYAAFATSPWLWLLLPVQILLSPVHGAIINWFAHKFGYENFEMKNTSENLIGVDFLMLGESYHNNHHKRPSAINFGYRWHEIDPVYPIILLFNKLHVIRINPVKPETVPIQSTIKEEELEEELVF